MGISKIFDEGSKQKGLCKNKRTSNRYVVGVFMKKIGRELKGISIWQHDFGFDLVLRQKNGLYKRIAIATNIDEAKQKMKFFLKNKLVFQAPDTKE